jgi:hypothetical protein
MTWRGAVVAAILAALLCGWHLFTAFAMAVGEYEEHRSGYEELVRDHLDWLLAGSVAGPVLLVLLATAVWRRAASARARSTS